MELMSYNIHANTALYTHCPPIALPLDWDEEELPDAVRDVRGGFDLVVQVLLSPSLYDSSYLCLEWQMLHTTHPPSPPFSVRSHLFSQ